MARLNDRAYQILKTEVKKAAKAKENNGKTMLGIVLQRLEKMRLERGDFATETQIREAITDHFPEFSPKVIRQAARANGQIGLGRWIQWGVLGVMVGAGGLWVVNLPFPPIRRPVAQAAPILLLPSFFQMDQNYRQAIAHVEQADQLLNQATSGADIALGAEKVKAAQGNLDRLPVWFLGYEPVGYCSFFGCSWRFTLDEFQAARQKVGRMEAQAFQETNALTALATAEQTLTTAKTQYQQGGDDAQRQAAIAHWQVALDQLSQIPPNTLAGRLVAQKLIAHERDFAELTGTVASTQQTNEHISVAKAFGKQAAQMSQNPPHPASKWQQILDLWEEAIDELNRVQAGDAGYVEAQTLRAQYVANLAEIKTREESERQAIAAFEQANNAISRLLANTPDDAAAVNKPATAGQIQEIITELEKIETGTTAHAKAQELLISARAKLAQLQ